MISSQLMHKDIVTILPMESIQTAAKKMRDKHADVVVILGEDGSFKGLLTEKDLTDFACDDENRCNYFSEVAIDLLMNPGFARQAADNSPKRKHLTDSACDDENRCNYFSEVAIDLLMSG